MSTKKKIFILILGIEALAIAGLIVFLFYLNSDTVKANHQLELAQHYLLEEDYEQAIAAYEIVIQIDPKNTEAYLGLAQAYTESGDLQKAIEVLEEGYENTEAAKLQEEKEACAIELAQIEAALSTEVQTTEAQPKDTIMENETALDTETPPTEAQPEDTPAEVPPTDTQPEDMPVIEEQGREVSEETEKETQSEIKIDENTGNTKVEYQPDGSYAVYSYDKQGNLINKEYYSSNGNLDGYYIYSYDKQGNLIKEEWYHPNGSLSFRNINSYDEQDNLIKKEYYGSNGNLQNIDHFDKQGNRIKWEIYYTNGNLSEIYSYDEQGNIIKVEEYDTNGNFVKYYIYSYDEQGNIIKKEEYDTNGNLINTDN